MPPTAPSRQTFFFLNGYWLTFSSLVACLDVSFDVVASFSRAEGLNFSDMVRGHMFRFHVEATVSGLGGLN